MSVTKGKVLENFEVMPEQRAWLKRAANLHGLTKAEFIRMRVFAPLIEKEEE